MPSSDWITDRAKQIVAAGATEDAIAAALREAHQLGMVDGIDSATRATNQIFDQFFPKE